MNYKPAKKPNHVVSALVALSFICQSITVDSFAAENDMDCQPLKFPEKALFYNFKAMRSRFSAMAYEGMPIGEIDIVTLPVFNPENPDENNALYRFINTIHTPTRDYVVKRQLLIKEGDSLQNRLLLESERLLRDNSYLSDAIILPKSVCNGVVNLVVVVRDLWTLLPKLLYSRKGGNDKYGLTLEDENFLGTGNTVFLQFINDRERDTSTLGFSTKQLFGTRVVLDATYSDSSDGINKQLEISRPFYAMDTRWSLGMAMEEIKFEESLEAFDQDINAFDHIENNYQFFIGYSPGLRNGFTRRYTLGVSRTEDLFKSNNNTVITPPQDRTLVFPWVKYSIVENAFAIYRNLTALYRTEDVPIGADFSATLGYADDTFNSEFDQWVFSISYKNALFNFSDHLMLAELAADGFKDRDADELLNTISGVDLSYYWLIADRHRAFAGVSYEYGENLTQDYLMPLGGDEGLRGYPSEYLLGDRRFLLNLEYRYFLQAHFLNLFRFAGVLFYDVGETHFSDVSFGDNRGLLSSAGFGVRINSSKTNISRIVHIDLAFPLDEKNQVDDYQLRITSDATF